MKPTSRDVRSRSAPGTRATRRRSRRARRRRTSRAPRGRAPTRRRPRRRRRAPRPPRRRCARRAPRRPRRSSRSTERERLHQRRQRLHRGADDDLLAVRDAGLDAAGAVRRAAPVGADLVVRLRAAQPGEREAVADLDALHGLDAHHRRGEPRVEPVLLAGVACRAPAGRRAPAPRRGRRACRDPCAPRRRPRIGSCLRQRLARHLDPDLAEERLRHRAGRDVHRRVPRRRPLERVADVVEPVLLHAGEVGVAGPRQRDRLRALSLRARPRAATGSSPTSSSCGRGCGRRARAACRACARDGGPRAPRPRPSRSAGAASGRSPAGAGAGRRRSPSRSRTSPAGRPETIATSAGPCDSPAVASSSVMAESVVR